MRSIMIFIVMYASLAVGLSLFGRPLARTNPGVLSAFSFKDGPLAWSYTFRDGVVVPFSVGDSSEIVAQKALECGCFTLYPRRENEPRSALDRNNVKNIIRGENEYNILLTKVELWSIIQYELKFKDNRLSEIRLSSALFSGM